MNEIKQPIKKPENATSRNTFWGTIALAVIAFLVSAYFFNFLLRESKTAIVYMGIMIFATGMATMVASIIFTIRGRQDIGVKLTFYTLFLLGVGSVGLFQGRAVTAIPTVVIISIIAVAWLFPEQLRRRYAALIAIEIILLVAVEWINPSWRIQIAAAKAGPIGAIVFGIVLIGLALSQFRNYSLRTKLLGSFLVVSLIPLGIVFFINNRASTRDLTASSDATLKGVAAQTGATLDTYLC